MNWIVIVIGIILLLLLIITITKLKVTIDLKHAQDNDQFKIKFKAWFGLIRYTIDVPLVEVDKESPGIVVEQEKVVGSETNKAKEKTKKYSPKEILNGIKDTKELIEHVVGLHKIVRKFLSRVSITKFEWHTNLGMGDAAYTGLLVGLGWSLKGCTIGVISNYMRMKIHPVMSITPFFQQSTSQTQLVCMIQFRIGYAMLAGLRLVKFWKGGRLHFKNRPFSA